MITIEQASMNIDEAGTATITLIADDDPVRTDLMVSYTPNETSTNTSYLKNDSDGNGTGVTRTASLDFDLNTTTNKWEAEIEIETNDDNQMDERNGVILVTLNSPGAQAGYTIGTDPNDRVTINVKDGTVPTITIEDANGISPTQTAQFQLTANTQPWQPLAIRYTPSETGSNFLAPAAGSTGTPTSATPSITFTDTNGSPPITGTLLIPTIADNANTSGTISIELLADSNTTDPSYMITGNQTSNTKTVQITTTSGVTPRLITIEQTSIDINEGGTATITLIADGDPERDDLMVSYTPSETSTNTSYLKNDTDGNGTGMSRTATLDFELNTTTSKWEAEIEIETNDDNQMDNPNGVILVTLNTPGAQAGYTIGTDPNDRVTINVKDGTVPTITIANATAVIPNNNAEFTLTADTQPWQSLTIRYTPTETGTSFLAPAAGISGTPTAVTTPLVFTDTSGSPPNY